MNRMLCVFASSAILVVMVAGGRAAVAHPQGAMVIADSSIHIEAMDGDVVITAHDHSEAHITRTGGLSIDGRDVPVTARQRDLLLKYVAGVDKIQRQGLQVGMQAVNMVGGFVGILVSDLLTGADDEQFDNDMKTRTEPLKTAARDICTSVQTQKRLQDAIVGELPAFKPYAVIDNDTQGHCHIDED